MSNINTLVLLSHGDKAATLEAFKAAFKSDITIYIRGNKSALLDARQNLKNSPKDQAVNDALTAGIRETGTAYYIAPKGVKFDAQSPEDLAMWNKHIDAGCAAFNESLDASNAWDKVVKTEAEKLEAKNKKETKTLELVNAEVAKLGLVDPKTIRPFSADELKNALLDEVLAGHFDRDSLVAMVMKLEDAISVLDVRHNLITKGLTSPKFVLEASGMSKPEVVPFEGGVIEQVTFKAEEVQPVIKKSRGKKSPATV